MLEFLKKVSLFQNLNESQLSAVHDISSKRKYTAGTILFHENESGHVFYILISGSIKIYTTSTGGEEKILSVFKSGDSFGELSLIDNKPRSASAETMEDSVVLSIADKNFLNLLKDNFEINLCILKELSNRIRETNQHVHDLTFLDARTRIIKSLIVMANKYGVRNGTIISIKMNLNYDELSRMAGVTINDLTQAVRHFEDRKILTLTPTDFTLDLSKLRS